MVKTLRITTVVAVIIAIAIFALPAIYGIQKDENIEKFLNAPGVIEKFNATSGNRTQINTNQVHPLVQQAQEFALILDPPKPVINTARKQFNRPPVAVAPAKNSPMFKLIITSYYANKPELSIALIDEPGKGTHWVGQSSKVNHLLIDQIKDGVIVVKNGDESFELKTPEKKMPQVSLSSSSPSPTKPNKPILPRTGPITRAELESMRARSNPVKNKPEIAPKTEVDPEKEARVQELIERIRSLGDSGDNSDNPSPSTEERAAQIQKLISEFRNSNMNINDEEAQKLTDLGEMLEKIQPPDSEPK